MKHHRFAALVLAATTILVSGFAHALPSEPDIPNCENPDWQPAECPSGGGSWDSDVGEYTVIGKDVNPTTAYNEAISEANNLCNSYDIEQVRWKQLPQQWKATIDIQC